jgi:predicted PilT family ATPase
MMLDEDEIIKELDERFREPYGVQIFEIMVTDVKLPENIATALENETTFITDQRFQKRKQEFDVVKTQNRENIQKMNLEHQNHRLKVVEEQKQKVQLVSKQIDEIFGRTEQKVAEIESESKRTIQLIKEESEQYSQKLNAKKKNILLEAAASANAKSEELLVSASAYEQNQLSKAGLEVAMLKAKALKLRAESEEKANKKLKLKREFDQQVGKVAIFDSLNQNQNTILKGTTKGNLIAQIAGAKMENHLYEK